MHTEELDAVRSIQRKIRIQHTFKRFQTF